MILGSDLFLIYWFWVLFLRKNLKLGWIGGVEERIWKGLGRRKYDQTIFKFKKVLNIMCNICNKAYKICNKINYLTVRF